MKFLLVLSFCALALGAYEVEQIPPPGISVTKDLGRTQYELQFLASNLDELQGPESDQESILSYPARVISGAILEMLEAFRDLLLNGNENIGPLDPLVIDSIGPFEFRPSLTVVARGTLSNVRMEGLRWFVPDRVTVNPVRLSLGMTLIVPALTFTGSYDANARILLIRHNAAGDIRIFAHRIDLSIDMRMGTGIFGNGNLFLRELLVKFDIFDTHVSVTGMTGSSYLNNLISSMIQSSTQEMIQNGLENVSQMLSEGLFDVINDILKDYTVSDIFG